MPFLYDTMRLTIRISNSKDSAETDPKPEDYVQLSEDMGFAMKDDDLLKRMNEGRYLYEY